VLARHHEDVARRAGVDVPEGVGDIIGRDFLGGNLAGDDLAEEQSGPHRRRWVGSLLGPHRVRDRGARAPGSDAAPLDECLDIGLLQLMTRPNLYAGNSPSSMSRYTVRVLTPRYSATAGVLIQLIGCPITAHSSASSPAVALISVPFKPFGCTWPAEHR